MISRKEPMYNRILENLKRKSIKNHSINHFIQGDVILEFYPFMSVKRLARSQASASEPDWQQEAQQKASKKQKSDHGTMG